MKRILITGAAGTIGKVLRQGLKNQGLILRLSDIAPLGEKGPNEELIQADISDLDSLKSAMKDVDFVVHLAGFADEGAWEKIFPINIGGTFNVFEAARQAGVKRILFASSNHAVGFHRKETVLNETTLPRPDGLYGASKVFGEAIGRLYADKHGLSVACLRIGTFADRPRTVRELRTWISPRDFVQLTLRCIQSPKFHFIVVYGVSANTQSKWDNSSASFLNYKPEDNAEDYRKECNSGNDPIANQFHGGPFCSIDFDGDPSSI